VRPGPALASFEIRRVPFQHADYPPAFTELETAFPSTAPLVLHAIGAIDCLHESSRTIAIVGARSCTPHARQHAWRLGHAAATAGLVVVSGAARGIDQAAMQGAHAAGGRVVAVLGSGLSHPYPKDSIPLLRAIASSQGCVLTEFADEISPRPYHFPQRNRLLAALSHAVVVVEAGRKSGSMNTATWAGQFGREVGACPGLAGSASAMGNHDLLRNGAAFIEEIDDLLGMFAIGHRQAGLPHSTGIAQDTCPVLLALAHEGLRFDDLLRRCKLTAADLEVRLSELELSGQIHVQFGGLYHRAGQ